MHDCLRNITEEVPYRVIFASTWRVKNDLETRHVLAHTGPGEWCVWTITHQIGTEEAHADRVRFYDGLSEATQDYRHRAHSTDDPTLPEILTAIFDRARGRIQQAITQGAADADSRDVTRRTP